MEDEHGKWDLFVRMGRIFEKVMGIQTILFNIVNLYLALFVHDVILCTNFIIQ